jgi:RNA polymerase sigma factor (sigma-70 family)
VLSDYVEAVQVVGDAAVPEAERERAFGQLMERFRGMVYSTASGFLGDPMQADDAVQETFLTAWRHIGKLREPAAFPGWIRRIALWQCHYFRRAERPSLDIENLAERLGDDSDLLGDAERGQLLEQVREVLWSVPRQHREILILHYLEHYSHAELAGFLELSEGAVRKRLHDARQRTKGLYERWVAQLEGEAPRRTTEAEEWRTRVTQATRAGDDGRTAQEKIDAMHRPKSCVTTEAGRLYWDLVSAAIRDDVKAIEEHLRANPDCAQLEFWYTPAIHFAVREGNVAATRALWHAHPSDEVTKLIRIAEDRGHSQVADVLRDGIGEKAAESDLRLHEAVEADDGDEISRLLSEVDGIGARCDPEGRTALHAAARGGKTRAVEAILKAGGVELEATDFLGFRAVHCAIWPGLYWNPWNAGGVALMQVLLAAGAADSISLAAARGDLAAVCAFVEADSTAVDDGEQLQKRPLSAAVEGGHRDIVRFLLDQGADPNLREGCACPKGSALMTASVNDEVEVARMLLEAGADPNAEIDSSGTPTGRAGSDAMRGLMYGHGGKAPGAWGWVQRGELETMAVILNYCDDPFTDEPAEFQSTPYTAVISGYLRNKDYGKGTDAHEAMLTMFLQRQHPMPTVLTECKSYLYHAPHMTKQLLEHGLDPNLPDWLCRTPLHDVCAGGRHIETSLPLIEMFLEHGADIEAVDEEDRSTPLGIAAREGDRAQVELLLEKGADPNGAGAPWATPLAWAERRRHTEIAALLRERGA